MVLLSFFEVGCAPNVKLAGAGVGCRVGYHSERSFSLNFTPIRKKFGEGGDEVPDQERNVSEGNYQAILKGSSTPAEYVFPGNWNNLLE